MTSKAGHMFSDGPWIASPVKGEDPGDEKFVIRSDNEIIAFVYGYIDHPNNIANARLVAAAPDLLAAAEIFTKAAHEVRDVLNARGLACPSSIALAAEKARAAIAKVEGGAS